MQHSLTRTYAHEQILAEVAFQVQEANPILSSITVQYIPQVGYVICCESPTTLPDFVFQFQEDDTTFYYKVCRVLYVTCMVSQYIVRLWILIIAFSLGYELPRLGRVDRGHLRCENIDNIVAFLLRLNTLCIIGYTGYLLDTQRGANTFQPSAVLEYQYFVVAELLEELTVALLEYEGSVHGSFRCKRSYTYALILKVRWWIEMTWIMSYLDCLISFASCAKSFNFTR